MKKLSLIILIICIILIGGCSNDNMDNIDIVVTNYPNEYLVRKIYSKHSSVENVYPDGENSSSYTITDRKKNKIANSDLFIYNGKKEEDKNLAFELLDINPDLKIIDSAYALEYDYSYLELYLMPSQLLMMAQNIRQGLIEYAQAQYLIDDVNDKYDNLKITLSELDASIRVSIKNANKKEIVVSNSNLKFLENYGLDVHVINEDTTDDGLKEIENLIKDNKVNYIYSYKDEETSTKLTNLLSKYSNVTRLYFYTTESLTDTQRDEKINYINLMNNNLDELKKELYN